MRAHPAKGSRRPPAHSRAGTRTARRRRGGACGRSPAGPRGRERRRCCSGIRGRFGEASDHVDAEAVAGIDQGRHALTPSASSPGGRPPPPGEDVARGGQLGRTTSWAPRSAAASTWATAAARLHPGHDACSYWRPRCEPSGWWGRASAGACHEDGRAVVGQLGDRLADVVEGAVRLDLGGARPGSPDTSAGRAP